MNLSNNIYALSSSQKMAGDVGHWYSSILHGLHGFISSLASRYNKHREMMELNRFSDRELWDVGLSRSDVLSIEKGVYTRN